MIFLSNSLETEEEDEESKMESIPTAKQSAKKMKTNWLRFQSWVCDLYRLSGAIDYSSELITRWLISKSLSLSLSLFGLFGWNRIENNWMTSSRCVFAFRIDTLATIDDLCESIPFLRWPDQIQSALIHNLGRVLIWRRLAVIDAIAFNWCGFSKLMTW